MPPPKVRRPMAGKPVWMALAIVLAVALSGCNLKDWYDQVGTVRVELRVVGAEESDVEQFQSLRLTVRSAQVRQQAAANPLTSAGGEAVIHDLARMARTGERAVLLEERVNLRGFESVGLKIEVIDGVSADGETIPGCEQGVTVQEPPCIRFARQGAYPLTLDPAQFRVPRGGTMVIVFPLAVHYSPQTGEYFVASKDAELVEP